MAEETQAQHDADKLHHQAKDEHHEGKHGKGATKNVESQLSRHRDLIIVGLSLVSIIIAVVTMRGGGKKKDAASDSADGADSTANPYDSSVVPTSGNGGGGYVTGSGDASDIAGQYADLTSTLTQAISAAQEQQHADAADAAAGQQSYFDNLNHELSGISHQVGTVSSGLSALPGKLKPVKAPTKKPVHKAPPKRTPVARKPPAKKKPKKAPVRRGRKK